MNEKHTCVGAPSASRATVSHIKFLKTEIPKLLDPQHEPTGQQAVDAIKFHHGYDISLRQAQKILQELKNQTYLQQEKDYAKIPAYLEALRAAYIEEMDYMDDENGPGPQLDRDLRVTRGEGFHVDFKTDPNNRFKRVFISPPHSAMIFEYSLPFLALDGTYIRNCFHQTLLVASCRDSNNNIFPLAWAIVESENKDSWTWFLVQLKTAIRRVRIIRDAVLISDRDKGLLAADQELNNFHRAYCCWHIQKNIKDSHGGELASKIFMELIYASNQVQWDAIFKKLEKASSKAAEYIKKLDTALWCLKDFPGSRFGHVTSGISEVFNSLIAKNRELSTLELLNSLWNRAAELRTRRHKEARDRQALDQKFTSYAEKLLAEVCSKHWRFTARLTANLPEDSYLAAQVRSTTGQLEIVRWRPDSRFLIDRSCSCKRFQDRKFPCVHAAAALSAGRHSVTEAIDDIYLNSNLIRTYANPIFTILLEGLMETPNVREPLAIRRKGRQQKKRKERGDGYGSTTNKKPRCGRCNGLGHNKRTCKADDEDIFTIWEPMESQSTQLNVDRPLRLPRG